MIPNTQGQRASQQQPQSESSQVILERIRQKLGIASQAGSQGAQQQNSAQARSQSQQQNARQQQAQAQRQPSAQQQRQYQQSAQNSSQESQFDDFSFDNESLDFAPQQSTQGQSSREINSLLRSYNVNNQNSYKVNQASMQNNQEWNEFEEEDELDQEFEQEDLNFDSQEEYSDEDEDEMYEEQAPQANNVHFLKSQQAQAQQNGQNQQQGEQYYENQFNMGDQSFNIGQPSVEHHFNLGEQKSHSQAFDLSHPNQGEANISSMSQQLEQMISGAISSCVSQWCEQNLESLCREVIKDELRKTA